MKLKQSTKFLSFIIFILIAQALNAQDFITRDGSNLVYNGQPIKLKGFAFGNLVWGDYNSPFGKHHTEKDFEELKSVGMNAVRFYMNYKTFEDDAAKYTYKQEGWRWLDSNITWAKKNNIFLILNMHVPQGGYQSNCGGAALWDVQENQTRLAALWNAIALRYRNEPQIAGYDILNEPIPTGSVAQWSNLARRIIDTIRDADRNHLIITERAIAVNCDYSYNDGNFNYPDITEENLMYTVHLYDPYEFTHQNLEWAGTGDGGKYPDENMIAPPSDLQYAGGNYSNPALPAGNSDWTYYEGYPFWIGDDSLIMGRVVFISSKLGTGKAYFDDIVLSEYDENENFIRNIYVENLKPGTSVWSWSANNDGSFQNSGEGHNDNFSVTATGTAGLGTITLPATSFKVRKGFMYKVSGWMKGENIPAGANALITTEFYKSPSGKPVLSRNYEFLKAKISDYSAYVASRGYPVYFGEFGVARNAFQNGKGGEKWVGDALKIFDSLGFHWTYHSYKESSFGYYDGWDEPINRNSVNTLLKTTFENYFNGTLSVKEIAPAAQFKIYPNPAGNDIIYIENGFTRNLKAQISDSKGKIIWTGHLSSETGSVVEGITNPGLYILHIFDDDVKYSYKIIRTSK